MFYDSLILALKNLRRRGIRSWLTILGVFIGIAAVVSLISLGAGLKEAITGQFATLEADKLIIQNSGTGFGPPGSTAVRKLAEHDLDIIENINGVELAVPRLIRIAKVELNRAAIFNGVSSLPDDKEKLDAAYGTFDLEIERGRLVEANDRGVIVVGNGFAENDVFGKKIDVGTDLIIQGEEFEIVGILKESNSIFLNEDILMPEEDLRELLDIGDEIDMIEVNVEDSESPEDVANDIGRELRRDRNQKIGEEDFSVQTPLQSISAISTVLNIVNLIVSGIAAISLIVGGIGIANIMYSSVVERTREIGVMKSIGARNRDIAMIFIMESGMLGFVGGIIGIVLGLGLAFGISGIFGNFLGGVSLEVSVSYWLIGLALAFSLFVGILSGLLPAIQASRLNPVEALRK